MAATSQSNLPTASEPSHTAENVPSHSPYAALLTPATTMYQRAQTLIAEVMVWERLKDEERQRERQDNVIVSLTTPPPMVPITIAPEPVTSVVSQRLYQPHTDQVLQHALYVVQQYAALQAAMSCVQSCVDAPLLFAQLSSSLVEAERHAAVLETLQSMTASFTKQRAVKGGHAKNIPPARKDQENVMLSLIKAMLFNLSSGEKIHWPQAYNTYGHQIADHICNLNHALKLFTCYANDQEIRKAVESFFRDKLKKLEVIDEASGRKGRLRYALHFGNQKRVPLEGKPTFWLGKDVHEQEHVHLAKKQLAIDILVFMLEERFGELPAALAQQLNDCTMDELADCYTKLWKAASYDEVLTPVA